ncbi:hypothetical protein ACFSL6_04505 [Paenibacillus thailandensis]|uniref:Uncharacterized protein n=1 Tax=Paenibacillus thailandensis TaxID=393250 RepID=A0ABW5R1L6_9BACL
MKRLLLSGAIVFLLLFAFLAGPWLLMYIGLSLTEDPPRPAYAYGEFPFYLEYEVEGQVKIVKDAVIVKHDGFGLSTGSGGKYIKWKQTLASGNKDVVLFQDGDKVKIIHPVRERDYHLEDKLENEDNEFRYIKKEVRKGGRVSINYISEDELFNEYKIRLVEFKYGEPLKK